MVTPVVKREAVTHLQARFGVSERRARRIAGVVRRMVRYRSQRPADGVPRGRLRELANERRRFGYRRLFVLLWPEGDARRTPERNAVPWPRSCSPSDRVLGSGQQHQRPHSALGYQTPADFARDLKTAITHPVARMETHASRAIAFTSKTRTSNHRAPVATG